MSEEMVDKIRRVITGETADGRGVFTDVEEVTPLILGGTRWFGVWGWDEPPAFPYLNRAPYVPRSLFPDPEGRGLRINVVEFPAGAGVSSGFADDAGAGLDLTDAVEYQALVEAQPHGQLYAAATGMHSTDSIDIGLVLSGEICLEQDEGEEVTLRRGDVYVQNGAIHAWRNRTAGPCMVAFLLMSFGGRTGPRRVPEGAVRVDLPDSG